MEALTNHVDSDPVARSSYFVSDLHLLSQRSTGNEFLPELREKISNSHTFVLGGDIFDFKWSAHPSFAESLDTATEWLENLITTNDHCEVHFILGNHDSQPRFVQRLEMLASQRSNFQWHRYFVRLEQCLFLHGDVADGELDHDRLDDRRTKHEHTKNLHPAWHAAYELATHARLHRVALTAIRKMAVMRRVREYAHMVGDNGIPMTDIYFGHIHKNIDDVELDGIRFHNGGAAIRGLEFRVVETRLAKQTAVASRVR